MKLNTPFTILNEKFNEMDLIRHAIKSKGKSRLKDDMMTIEKFTNLIPALCIPIKNLTLLVNDMFNLFDKHKLLRSYFI